jgi:hypothetical protein
MDNQTKMNTQAFLSALFRKLTISSDSQVNIDPETKIDIDSDSLVTIAGGFVSIIGAGSTLSMESAKLVIDNGGIMTLSNGQLVNAGDAIEIFGRDSSLYVSNGGELINSDSCSIIIDGGPLDIEDETFTNNDPIMYVGKEGMIEFLYDGYDLFSPSKLSTSTKNDYKTTDLLNGDICVAYNQGNTAVMTFFTGGVSVKRYGNIISEYVLAYPSDYDYHTRDAYFDENGDLMITVSLLEYDSDNIDIIVALIAKYKNENLIETVDFKDVIISTYNDTVVAYEKLISKIRDEMWPTWENITTVQAEVYNYAPSHFEYKFVSEPDLFQNPVQLKHNVDIHTISLHSEAIFFSMYYEYDKNIAWGSAVCDLFGPTDFINDTSDWTQVSIFVDRSYIFNKANGLSKVKDEQYYYADFSSKKNKEFTLISSDSDPHKIYSITTADQTVKLDYDFKEEFETVIEYPDPASGLSIKTYYSYQTGVYRVFLLHDDWSMDLTTLFSNGGFSQFTNPLMAVSNSKIYIYLFGVIYEVDKETNTYKQIKYAGLYNTNIPIVTLTNTKLGQILD